MKKILLFVAVLLTTSFALSANGIAKSNSTQSQSKQEAKGVVSTVQKNVNNSSDLVLSGTDKIQIADTGDLAQIRRNTEVTAKNTDNKEYEDVTLSYSKIAIIIACVTLFFTIITFISQRITQKNTTPVFTKKKQFEVLKLMAESIIDKYIQAGVIKLKIATRENSNEIPSELIYSSSYIDSSELHLELFYKSKFSNNVYYSSENQKNSDYSMMECLKAKIDSYNNMVSMFVTRYQEQSVAFDDLIKEYDYYVIKPLIEILEQLTETSNSIYNKKRLFFNDKSRDLRYRITNYLWFKWDTYSNVSPYKINTSKVNEDPTKKILDKFNNIAMKSWLEIFDYYDIAKAVNADKELSIDDVANWIKVAVVGEYKSIFKEEAPVISYNIQA